MKRALARLALAAGALCLALAAAELFLQLFRPIRLHRITSLFYQGCEDPVLLYEPKALVYDHNGDTLRGPERPVAKPPGIYRILVAGDSLAYGVNVDGDKIYSARLEAMLNRHAAPDRRFEVLNLGCSGYRIQQVVARIRKRGLKYQPDLIIYGCWLDDVVDSTDGAQQAITADIRAAQDDTSGLFFNSAETRGWWRGLALRSQLVRRFIALSRARRRAAEPTAAATPAGMEAELGPAVSRLYQAFCAKVSDGTFKDLKGAVNNRSFEPYYRCYTRYDDFAAWNQSLRELRQLSDDAGCRAMILLTPVIYDAPRGRYAWTGVHELIRDVAAVHGLPVLDEPRSVFALHPAAETGLGDTEHPNAFGHELIAESLFRYLSAKRDEYGLPLDRQDTTSSKGAP